MSRSGYRRPAYLETRVGDVESRLTRAEAAIDSLMATARPEGDSSARERVGEAPGLGGDRSEPPDGYLVECQMVEDDDAVDDDTGVWVAGALVDGDGLEMECEEKCEAVLRCWQHYDRITAPLRTECEQLRERVRELESVRDFLHGKLRASVSTIEQLTKERDEAQMSLDRAAKTFEELSDGYLARAEKAEKDGSRYAVMVGRIEKHLGITTKLDDGEDACAAIDNIRERRFLEERSVQDSAYSELLDRLEDARRSTIEELAREAEGGFWYTARPIDRQEDRQWLRDWLRSKLDDETAEQPTPDASSISERAAKEAVANAIIEHAVKNARRSTIEELAREAEYEAELDENLPRDPSMWEGRAVWLRTKLDTEPTEQPIMCLRCASIVEDVEHARQEERERCAARVRHSARIVRKTLPKHDATIALLCELADEIESLPTPPGGTPDESEGDHG